MSLITFKHGATVQLKNLRGTWYELVNPQTVREIQEAELALGSSQVNERTNARMLEQIAKGAEKLHCGQFKFYNFDKDGCLQHCRILERLARIELLELDAVVEIQKIWRGRAPRMWWGNLARKWRKWQKYELVRNTVMNIQAIWRGIQTRKEVRRKWWWVGPRKALAKVVLPENIEVPPPTRVTTRKWRMLGEVSKQVIEVRDVAGEVVAVKEIWKPHLEGF